MMKLLLSHSHLPQPRSMVVASDETLNLDEFRVFSSSITQRIGAQIAQASYGEHVR